MWNSCGRPKIDFIVPQRWDSQLTHLDPEIHIPVTLRVAKDVPKRRLVLLADQLTIPLSRRQTFLCHRRAAVDFKGIGSLQGHQRALIGFA